MNPFPRILIVEVGKTDDPVKIGEKLTIAATKDLSAEVGKKGEQGKTGGNRHRIDDISTRF